METSSNNATGVKAAWIRLVDPGGTENQGRGLLAWTRWIGGSTPRAAFAYSANWTAATPVWNVGYSADPSPALKWPMPSNFCQLYFGTNCAAAATQWSATGRYSHVHAALWTGLDNVAAVVSSCGVDTDDDDVCITTSVDGAATFIRSTLLTVPDKEGIDTGGNVDPESVQATLAYFGERQNGNIGDLGLPIYVTWRNLTPNTEKAKWYFTRVVVGATGDIAESTLPRELTMPDENGTSFTAGNHATVFGYRNGEHERIAVAYSDRSDALSPTNCNNGMGSPIDVSWWLTQSDDMGKSWGCFTGMNGGGNCLPNSSVFPPNSSSARTLLATSTGWRPCVGVAMVGASNVFAKNNDRPEVAMHAPALTNSLDDSTTAQLFFFALNVKHASQNRQQIKVFRTGGQSVLGSPTHNLIQQVWAEGGSGITDSWAQSLAVISRNAGATSNVAGVTVAYRSNKSTGMRIDAQQWQESIQNSFLSPQAFGVSSNTGGSPAGFPFEAKIGLQTGIASFQGCGAQFAFCPNNGLYSTWTQWGILFGWEDSRDTGRRVNDVYSRGGSFQ